MLELILTGLLSLPLYPLNPVEQDTLPPANLHLSVGAASPTELLPITPLMSVRGEWMLFHPFVLRPSVDYRFGHTRQGNKPDGFMHQVVFGLEGFLYRGTSRLTGYAGFGLIWAVNDFDLDASAADSLQRNDNLAAVTLDNSFGYRISLGVRWSEVYSIEVNVTELDSRMHFTSQQVGAVFQTYSEEVDLGDFRVNFGYLFNLHK